MNDTHAPPGKKALLPLAVAALGVVYGDIGTSPLYALRECFWGPHASDPTAGNVMGVLSLVFWSLVLVISVKYLAFVMRADNRGEGGILALMALVRTDRGSGQVRRAVVVALGLFGAALLYGDGMITPAISVLSALEGLDVATPVLTPYIQPLTIFILVVFFMVQHRGTAKVGALFGPVTVLWFFVIAALGIGAIARNPGILAAVNPVLALDFFRANGWHGFFVLGTVFLVVTGGEALYADMGHFGRHPIQVAWFALVLPSLLLNYFGQGALLLADPEHAHNPFYRLVPSWALYPVVALATVATVIASQAVISGAFSLTRQAVQLGYAPRVRIEHTSSEEIGQIYVPGVNWAIMLATIALVLSFRTSSNLAAAYGIAVTSTMFITTILAYLVARERWGWPLWTALPAAALLLVIDVAFLGANLVKVPHGGWFTLVVAGAIYTLMTTWKRGREILRERLEGVSAPPVGEFLSSLSSKAAVRLKHPAVFMSGSPSTTPPALVHNLRHNEVLHDPVILLTLETENVPHVREEDRLSVEPLGKGFYRVSARYGFMEDPNVPRVLSQLQARRPDLRLEGTTYFLGLETVIPTHLPGMALWRERLFAVMARNTTRATTYFRIPPDRVVELGMQVEI